MLTLLSRLLGLVRDMATAHVLGAGLVNDALSWAWTVPNGFRRLFGEGALSSAFVPVFLRVHQREGLSRAAAVARSVIYSLALLLVVLVALLVALTWLLPGRWEASLFGDQETARVTLAYTRLLLPYLAVICVIAQFMAVLNSLDEFMVPALSSVVLNVVWICGIVAAALFVDASAGPGAPHERQGYVIIGAILLASVLQTVWHLPTLRRLGVPMGAGWPGACPEMREVVTIMVPMLIGAGSAQLNVLVDRTIAIAQLPDGGTTHLYYGLRIGQFPIGLVPAALVTAVFPTLSRLMAQGDVRGTAATARLALRTSQLISVPAAVGLAVLARPIVQLLFAGGEFGPQSVERTAQALQGYSAGIPFAGTVMLLNRVSYAAGDMRLPVRIGLGMVVVNVALDFALVGPLKELGLALATTLTALLTSLCLEWGVRRRLALPAGESMLGGWGLQAALALVLALPLLLLDGLLEHLLPGDRLGALVRVGVGVACGLLTFRLAAPRLAPDAWPELAAALRRRRQRRRSDAGPD